MLPVLGLEHERDANARVVPESSKHGNHPSGSLNPSKIDIDTTRRIAAGAQAVGLKFLDHIIVGRDDSFSMARAGLLDA
ncbi:JAB domain-containing protein [Zavarzinella formosa]|uniref:JAB domain-containing protein n=1 Tax=Zavarzinella formosa TaxID=360055 RepID=UPI000907AC6D